MSKDERLYAPGEDDAGNHLTKIFVIIAIGLAAGLAVYFFLMQREQKEVSQADQPLDATTLSQLERPERFFSMPDFVSRPEKKAVEPEAEPPVVTVPDVEPEPQETALPIAEIPEPEPAPAIDLPSAPTPNQAGQNKPLSDLERRLSGSVTVQVQMTSSRPPVNSAARPEAESAADFDSGRLYQDQARLPAPSPSPRQRLTPQRPPAVTYAAPQRPAARSDLAVQRPVAAQRLTPQRPVSAVTAAPPPPDNGLPARNQPLNDNSIIDLSTSILEGTTAKKLDLTYLLQRGTFINCALKTRIVSDQAGFIQCTVIDDLYSASGIELIPRGSEVLGEYKPQTLQPGKVRLHAVWDALTTPNGIRIRLGSPATGRLGETGLSGHIDNHWGQRLGIPILLALAEDENSYRLIDGELSRQRAFYEGIQPTLTKSPGDVIGILVARDISFKDVLSHGMRP